MKLIKTILKSPTFWAGAVLGLVISLAGHPFWTIEWWAIELAALGLMMASILEQD